MSLILLISPILLAARTYVVDSQIAFDEMQSTIAMDLKSANDRYSVRYPK